MRSARSATSTLIGSMLLFAGAANAQLFSVVPEGPVAPGGWSIAGPRPTSGAIVRVEHAVLGNELRKAPMERAGEALRAYGRAIALPGPTGAMVDCFVAESPVMDPGLAARFPAIRTYIVQSADGRSSGRLEHTPRGITAMLRTANDNERQTTWMIDPWQSGDSSCVVSYWLRDLPGSMDWVCETTPGIHGFGSTVHDHDEDEVGLGGSRGTSVVRTVRLAMACTGEYGVHQSTVQGHAPNAADPLAAIVTIVARTNVVYEADLAVHFNLIANNDLIVYFDPATDPYPDACNGSGGSDCSGGYLAPNIANLSAVIGNENFDIGHLLTRVAGGVAYLRSVCGNNKAGGISGTPRGGDIDPFAANVVIHEIGHQFGANHTFSGARGRCAGNVNLSTAWEAGSGSSPMAYAGGCPVGDAPPSDNIVQFADPFFHHGSLLEMRNFLNDATCPLQGTTLNDIPTINSSTPNIAIPPGTPFTLTVSASDADGDVLTYSWEQRDSGVSRPLSGEGSEDNGAGALFRIFPPVLSPQRTFPQMSDILSGVPTPGERLPTVTGSTRRFRVVVRDNSPGAGGVAISSANIALSIPSGTSPFGVVSPALGAVRSGGTSQVTWTVGGTNVAPVSCNSVTIRLSLDNGATFPLLLGQFPNTGSANVTLPAVTTTARVRIDGDAEIFFAISRPFGIHAPCPADHNYDGVGNSQDAFAFLIDFFNASLAADFNHDGIVNTQDFFEYITAFFAGCP